MDLVFELAIHWWAMARESRRSPGSCRVRRLDGFGRRRIPRTVAVNRCFARLTARDELVVTGLSASLPKPARNQPQTPSVCSTAHPDR